MLDCYLDMLPEYLEDLALTHTLGALHSRRALKATHYVMHNVLYVAVCGNIGAGKSTLLEGLASRLSKLEGVVLHLVPEYLDDEVTGREGQEMLQSWIEGLITSRDFELYILQHYERKLSKLHEELAHRAKAKQEVHVVLFERLPAEISRVFLPEEEECWQEIHNKVTQLEKRYGLPTLPTTGPAAYCVDATKSQKRVLGWVFDKVLAELQRAKRKEPTIRELVFYLRAPVKVLQRRIARRAREGEQNYDSQYLCGIQSKYEKLFSYTH